MDGDEQTSATERGPLGDADDTRPGDGPSTALVTIDDRLDGAEPSGIGDEPIDHGRSDHDDDVDDDETSMPWWWPTTRYPGDEAAKLWLRRFVSFAVVAGCCGYVFWLLRPDLIFLNTTPTGGDMGAHVWGPAYLRDFLLPNGRLSGWSPDWYAGFPAYTFYMVVPSLAIVMLDVGFLPWWMAPVAIVACGALAFLAHRRLHGRLVRTLAFVACGLLGVLSVDIPYNIAFKVVAVAGLVAFPAAIWYLASGLSLRFPGPELLAIGSIPFLMDKTLFSILGGNIASTMAGEFSFSLSLTLGLFFLGTAARGMATGKYRAWGAVLLALCMLCHVIPAIYIGAATLVMFLTRLRWIEGAKTFGRFVAHPGPRFRAAGRRTAGWFDTGGQWKGVRGLGRTLKRPFVAIWNALPVPLRWSLPTGIVGVSITLFWYLPFGILSTYLNDMGWEKYGMLRCDGATEPTGYLREFMKYLYPVAPHATGCPGVPGTPTDDPNMLHGRVFFILAGVGVVLSLLLAVRAGIYFTLLGLVAGLGFWLMPQHRFWNARILPLYYLCIYLLAALGVWLVVRAIYLLVVGRWSHPPNWLNYSVLTAAAVVVFMVMQVSIREAPGGYATDSNGVVTTDAATVAQYHWGPFETTYSGPVRDWVSWNYEGYERKGAAWDELSGIKNTMAAVGQEHGCGRAFWEYEPNLNRFGTPMALMLLPYWTKSCIGSMEGLFFEASSTTPFHFVMQGELSKQCSCAQRFDIFDVDPSPYAGVNLTQGIDHLQMMGVKYFLATSDTVKQQASTEPRLTKVASTGPWDVYQVSDSVLVEGLDHLPSVWTNVDDTIHSWAKPATEWFIDPEQWDVYMASSGPESWPRTAYPDQPESEPVEPAKVSNVRATRDTISFDVDEIGKPVLVKTSFFPSWETDDATGPYRVTPNLMVVVPTSLHVELTYGRTPIENISLAISGIGLLLLLLLIRRPEPEGIVPWEMLGDREDPPRRDPEPQDPVPPELTQGDGTEASGDPPGVLEPVPAGAEAPPP